MTASSWRIIAAWCAAALAAVALLIFAVIPFMAQRASRWVSPRLEAELGDRIAGAVVTLTVPAADQAHPECDAPAGRAALDSLVAPLAAQITLRNPVRVRVINSQLVNALALPGGQILLFRGLLDFAQSPNEIAGVAAHEMGHLKLDHPTALVIQQGGTAFVIGLVLGDVFGGSAVAVAGTGMLDTAFSRDAESAADAAAVTLMTKAGLDVHPLGGFFERLGASRIDGDIPIAFLRTHPPSDERAKLIASAPPGGRQALTPGQWAALKAICD
jgi:predicted Zn-dependent protease